MSEHLGIRKRPTIQSQGFGKRPEQNSATREIQKWRGSEWLDAPPR